MNRPYTIVDDQSDGLSLYDSGDFICSVHGDTIGVMCDRATLLSKAPMLPDAIAALQRLIDADTPRPLGGIADLVERRQAELDLAVERGEARQHAREILIRCRDL